jgi:MinD superfamily P-loop ATPase
MIITVASGKGGTGKTTVATNLAKALSVAGRRVAYFDCDVEAPNAHLFMMPTFNQRQEVNVLIPQVDMEKCTGCGRCDEVCEFHAIVVLGGKPLVFPELCHGCGSCMLECPDRAIKEIPKNIGVLESGSARQDVHFARGLLNIGEPLAVPVIRELKHWTARNQNGITICDSPPGTSCTVVESMRGADFVILVTEPTPFGLHDLKLAAQLTRELAIPAGAVINRDGVGDRRVEAYCQGAGIPILLQIPLEKEIGEGTASGKLLTDIRPAYQDKFVQMYGQIEEMLTEQGVGG